MARLSLCYTVSAALCLIPTLIAVNGGELILCGKTPNNVISLFCRSNKTFHLILNPNNISSHCISEITVSGIQTCTGDTKDLPEKIQTNLHSPVTGADVKLLPNEDEYYYFSSNNTEFFIQQDMMEKMKHHFVKCRVQEDSENGCKGLSCDWMLINITKISDENDEGLGVTGCTCKNTSLTFCQLKTSKLRPDPESVLYIGIGLMVFISIISFVIWLLCDHCRKSMNAHPYVFYLEPREIEPPCSECEEDHSSLSEEF